VKPQIVPPPSQSHDADRLREALNRHADAFLASVDAALPLRQAPGEAARLRHVARQKLVEAGQAAMQAMALAEADRIR